MSGPVNLLALGNLELAEIVAAGAQRVSVGGGLTWVAMNAMVDAAREMREHGDFSSLGVSLPLRDWFSES